MPELTEAQKEQTALVDKYKSAEGKSFKLESDFAGHTVKVKYLGLRSLRGGEPRHGVTAERFNAAGRSVAIWTPTCKEFLDEYQEIENQ